MPRIDVALVYTDGRREVVSVGRPSDLIAFADKFEKIAPSEPYAVRELVWLAHRALRIEKPLEEWADELDDITSDDEQIEAIRADLDPPAAAAEAASPPTALTPVVSEPPPTESAIESHG